MDSTLVTLIMQNYNTPLDKLYVAVNSVINQSYNNIAFIFIDDWSTDYDIDEVFNTIKEKWNQIRSDTLLDLVKKPQSGYQDEVDHNHGHSFCRNWGLDLVRTKHDSEYVMFADSDDELIPNCIELLYNNMQKDNADISIGNFTRDEVRWCQCKDNYFDNVNDTIEQEETNFQSCNKLTALRYLCDPYMLPGNRLTGPSIPFCATWNKIFKLSLFDDVKFPSGYNRDDNFTAHRLLWNAKKVVFTQELTYFYRPGGNLADSNLYKSIDIVYAHRDRINFFEEVFPREEDITSDNANDLYEMYNIMNNERRIYLFTMMQVYTKINNSMDMIDILDEIKYCINKWKKELLTHSADLPFIKLCVKWLEDRQGDFDNEKSNDIH